MQVVLHEWRVFLEGPIMWLGVFGEGLVSMLRVRVRGSEEYLR